MVRWDARPVLALAALVVAVTACAPKAPPRLPVPAPAPAAVAPARPLPPPPPPQDPIVSLIAASQGHFDTGQRELTIGHLDRARAEFDLAIDVLLQSEYGARYDSRLREHFDRLVDRISAYEVTALAAGDGFTEKRYDPASIDALLEESTFPAAAPSPETKQAVASDLAATAHDISIPLNARVLTYIELFQGRLRDWFTIGLKRSARYLPMVQNVFRAEGLPLDLAYVPIIESAFNPNAVSRARAKGIWQFMAGTATENGLKRDWYIDERADPEKATQAAASYLHTLASAFSGDWHLALASYNGGPGLVQRACKRTRLNDFWSLTDKSSTLPRETREYVPMILAAIVIARNPAQYGFDLPLEPPAEYDKLKLSRPVDLRRIAEWTGSTVADIRELNPELRRLTTPVRYPDYEIKVPKGFAKAIEERLADLSPADTAALNWYTVKKGDTLTTIARTLRVSRTDLADANYLSSRAGVMPGQTLVVPMEPTVLLTGRPDRPIPLAESRQVGVSNRPERAPTAEPSQGVKLVYEVKPGDTLSSVAKVHRTTVAALKAWNHLNGDILMPGARLMIFAERTNRRQ
jgi:membrane-bound lytic murein transglycosylase D